MRLGALRAGAAAVFWIVVALQASTVIAFAAVREVSLRVGREIALETVPVDPRDLFRGDYVVLRYKISTLSACYWRTGTTIFVPLGERNGVWSVSGRSSSEYDDAATRGDVVIRGEVGSRGGDSTCSVTYGIESYFVPEGTGRTIAGTPTVIVSVDGTGSATIKRLAP